NMIDVAQNNGHLVDSGKLSAQLGVPVFPIVASEGQGLAELRRTFTETLRNPRSPGTRRFCEVPDALTQEANSIAALLAKAPRKNPVRPAAEALLILGNEMALASSSGHYQAAISTAIASARQRLEAAGVDWRGTMIEGRYLTVSRIQESVTTETAPP